MEIEKVAELARIRLLPEEKAKLTEELGAILKYVEKLNDLDVTGVETTSHVLDLENVYREDFVKPSPACEELLKHAPLTEGKLFKVPKVVER